MKIYYVLSCLSSLFLKRYQCIPGTETENVLIKALIKFSIYKARRIFFFFYYIFQNVSDFTDFFFQGEKNKMYYLGLLILNAMSARIVHLSGDPSWP